MSKITTDHDVIKKWAEERGGKPATVKSTHGKNDAGLLRIDFPEFKNQALLEPISWEEFFQKFDEKKLSFLYQEQTRDGKISRFFKFVSQETASKAQAEKKEPVLAGKQ